MSCISIYFILTLFLYFFAMDCSRWRKLIKDIWWSGWVWVGECFFWYRPTRVVPHKGLLNGCVCVFILFCMCRYYSYLLLLLCRSAVSTVVHALAIVIVLIRWCTVGVMQPDATVTAAACCRCWLTDLQSAAWRYWWTWRSACRPSNHWDQRSQHGRDATRTHRPPPGHLRRRGLWYSTLFTTGQQRCALPNSGSMAGNCQ